MAVYAVDGTIKVIYETQKLRSTGAHTRVWDMRADDAFDGNFKLECVTHETVLARDVRLKAEEESHRSHMWCATCEIPEAGKEKLVNAASKKHGTVVVMRAMPDSAKRNVRNQHTYPVASEDTTRGWSMAGIGYVPAPRKRAKKA
jgi:hypothetical protein